MLKHNIMFHNIHFENYLETLFTTTTTATTTTTTIFIIIKKNEILGPP